MSQLRSKAFPRHRKKKRWWTNIDKTNVTYIHETPTHDKEEMNRGTALERYVEKLLGGGGFNQFYSQKKNSHLFWCSSKVQIYIQTA